MILADLGVSSPHLDDAERGFSFMREGPLDMRMDQMQEQTAATLVNQLSEEELVEVIRRYGEEPMARKIAQAIVAGRPFTTTTELAGAIEDKIPRRGKTNPATRTFQAIRMAVNNELGQVEEMLNERCKSGYESTMDLITKRPILGSEEANLNPRSRSAVLRAAVKK